MERIKLLAKNQKKIIEGLFVSLISGWIFGAIARGTYFQISDLSYYTNAYILIAFAIFLVSTAIFAVIYSWNESTARIMMFVLVYIFALMCAFNGYDLPWGGSSAYNTIGSVCFDTVLCFLLVLTFKYVRNDVFELFKTIKITKKTVNIILVVMAVAIFVFTGVTTILRYLTYSNTTFDFGIFAQMYEYMRQKGMISTTVERNGLLSHFGVHFSPVFYLALPIYFLFPYAETLQLIQAFMIVLPVIPILLLCRHYKMSNWMCVAISLLYFVYPATSGGAFYDIHENCFLTFFILMTIWAIEKHKNVATVIFVLLTFSVKEDAAVYILVLGAYLLFSRRDKKRGIILMLVSLIYFAIAVSIVNSYGLGILDDRFENLYFSSDGGLFQIVETIILNPAYVLGQTIANTFDGSFDKIEYLLFMLVPMSGALFTTGKKYSRYILMMPFIIFNVITTYLYLHKVTFQYNFGVIALFMYVVIMNLSELKLKRAKTLACTSVICASILFMGNIFPDIIYYGEKYIDNKADYEQINTALEEIPQDASVSASKYLVPHLSKHLELYDQREAENIIYTDYIVIDESDEMEDYFEEMLASEKYESVHSVDGLIQVYKKIKE